MNAAYVFEGMDWPPPVNDAGGQDAKTRFLERVSLFPDRWARLRQHELNSCLDREVIAAENRDGGEGSVLALRVPALFECRPALALQRLAAHCRSEHAPLTPAPDFLAGEILHHEIVGLSVGKAQLEHLRRVVADTESEMELV